jgi:hypothetical protein
MDESKLKEKTEIARRAVEGLEEPLKTEGFKTILSKLLEEDFSPRPKKNKEHSKKQKVESNPAGEENLPAINRTQYPQIAILKGALERALFVLKIYRDEKKIDGLNPLQISKVLTDTFRLRTTKEAISMALMNARSEADRIPCNLSKGGRAYLYRLMKPGEDLLLKKLKNES